MLTVLYWMWNQERVIPTNICLQLPQWMSPSQSLIFWKFFSLAEERTTAKTGRKGKGTSREGRKHSLLRTSSEISHKISTTSSPVLFCSLEKPSQWQRLKQLEKLSITQINYNHTIKVLEQGGNQFLYINSIIAESREEGRERNRKEDSTLTEGMTLFFFPRGFF